VLTVTAAAAAVLPAGAAVAAPAAVGGPAGHGVTDALPTGALTGMVPTEATTSALGYGISPVRDLRLDPLARSGTDPLDNAVGSQIADFRPVSTAAVTGPISSGGSLGTLPVLGQVTGLLPH
jgi:hypothetical protein